MSMTLTLVITWPTTSLPVTTWKMRCRRSPGTFTLWASTFWMRDPKHTISLALSFTGQVITMGLGVVSGNLMSWVSQSRATSRWMLTTRFLISERSPFPWNSWTEASALRRVSALCHRICIQSEYNRAPSLSPLQGCSLLSLVSIMIFGWTPSNTQLQWSSARAIHKYNDLRLQQHTLSKLTVSKELRSSTTHNLWLQSIFRSSGLDSDDQLQLVPF